MKISTTKSDNTKYKIKLWEVWCLTWTQFKVISYENGIQINWSKSSFEESNMYVKFKEYCLKFLSPVNYCKSKLSNAILERINS